ncbi:hypothetical protein CW705_05805 [Candidatus Bathyarchaeota archaeon]|nr:MAG: hypothetical protein CW705_05805 [Candidatus Bathyarchaeota archaeon]
MRLLRTSLFSILISLCILVLLSNAGLNVEGKYIYFGYVPLNIEYTRIYIVGNHDATGITIYSLPEMEIIAKFVVDRMEEREVNVPSGSMLEIVSSKPATVILAGGSDIAAVNASISTFYTSVEGGYIGREFIFRTFYKEEGSGGVYTVYALEKSEVTVYDSSGAKVMSFDLAPHEFKDFVLESSKVYRISSTGYVMFQSFFVLNLGHGSGVWKSHAVPSLEGAFVGRHFYERCIYPGYYSGGSEPPIDFVFSSSSDAKIGFYDLDGRAKFGEEAIKAGTNGSFSFQKYHLFFETNKPATLFSIANGGGLLVGGLRAGEVACINVPSDESFLFAYTQTILSLDDVEYSLEPNSTFRLPTGVHKIKADKTVLFTLVHRGSKSGVGSFETSFGACLPSIRSVEIEYPNLKISPLGETSWMTYIEAAAAVIGIVVAVLVIKKVTSR